MFGLRIFNRGIGFLRTLILARLLAPADFGLLGIAMLAIAAIESFSQTGFQAALVRKREVNERSLDTAWTASAIRGAVLSIILIAAAPNIADFFHSTQAAPVMMVLAGSTLLTGLRNIGLIFFQKDLDFRKQFVYEITSTLADVVLTVSLAFVLRNVWALVWGGLAANFVGVLMSYFLHPYRPRFRLDYNELKELFHFGKWLTGSSMLLFLTAQGDSIFIGRVLGVTALGLYQMGFMLSNLPATEITHLLSQVTFPAYSKIRHDLPRLRASYLDVLKLTVYMTMPLSFGVYILAPDFTRIFLGDKWAPIAGIIQILVFAGLLRSIAGTAGPIFTAVGRPGIDTAWQTTRLIVLAVLIYPFMLRWGLLGASLSVLFSVFIITIGFGWTIIKVIRCSAGDFSKSILIPLLYSLIMTSVLLLFLSHMQPLGIGGFFFLVGTGIASYIVATLSLEGLTRYGIIKLLREKAVGLS